MLRIKPATEVSPCLPRSEPKWKAGPQSVEVFTPHSVTDSVSECGLGDGSID